MTDTKLLVLGFWDAVIECLVQFHKKDYGEAYLLALDLRRRLAAVGARLDEIDIFYNEEPFYVACTLAGQELDAHDYWERYEAILEGAYSGHTTPSPDVPMTQAVVVHQTPFTAEELSRSTSKPTLLAEKPSARELAVTFGVVEESQPGSSDILEIQRTKRKGKSRVPARSSRSE
ncbi:MAG: hypothetical protein HY681_08735 [Chloroflexi bacterium]|nr:hypothetical protein [Chloroflexota bacterium]